MEILPVLDPAILQEKANEYAMKGAIETYKEYYSGYNSPFRKAIEDDLKLKGIGNSIDLPDIIGIINESLSKEIDAIANNAVSKSFIPLVKRFLTRADAETTLSDILTKFIDFSNYDPEDEDISDYSLTVSKDEGSFLYMDILKGERTYRLNFYRKGRDAPNIVEMYTLPTVSEIGNTYWGGNMPKGTMTLSVDEVKLEMPFTPHVLHDRFMSFCAGLIIANTQIVLDVDDFNEDMFPQRECHCD